MITTSTSSEDWSDFWFRQKFKRTYTLKKPDLDHLTQHISGLYTKINSVTTPKIYSYAMLICILLYHCRRGRAVTNVVRFCCPIPFLWQVGNKICLPYKFYVLGQIGLSKQCRPRSDCFWRSSLIRVYAVCHSISIFWMHYCNVTSNFSAFSTIVAIVAIVWGPKF